MATQTPIGGARRPAAPAAAGAKKGAVTPLPSGSRGAGRWVIWLILVPLLLLGLAYLLGRTVEPVRARLVKVPLAGKLLFAEPVWPILWNKPAGQTPAATTPPAATGTGASNGAGSSASTPPSLSNLEAEIAARLAAVQVKSNELGQKEQQLETREKALRDREAQVTQQEIRLGQEIRAAEALRVQLEGQRRTELDRVAVIRSMRSSQVLQMLAVMTDEEVLRVLMYMDAEEVARILGGMESFRAARLLHSLREIRPATGTP